MALDSLHDMDIRPGTARPGGPPSQRDSKRNEVEAPDGTGLPAQLADTGVSGQNLPFVLEGPAGLSCVLHGMSSVWLRVPEADHS